MTLLPSQDRINEPTPSPKRSTRPTTPRARELLRLCRPGQWPKNVLVASAPAAAGVIDQGPVAWHTALVMIAFTAASGAVYAVNDVMDAELDRRHPAKRLRPVASGTVTPTAALALSAVAGATALVLAWLTNPATLAVLLVYLMLSLAYAWQFKHLAVLDIVVVAAGFLLRSLAGATASSIPVSNWFLLVALFGALYLVTAKRAAEATRHRASTARPVLLQYPTGWLHQVVGMALTGTVLTYAMWALQNVATDAFTPLLAGSVAPFLVALLRYGLLVARGDGERPEQLVLRDRPLVLAGGVWAAMVAIGLYAG